MLSHLVNVFLKRGEVKRKVFLEGRDWKSENTVKAGYKLTWTHVFDLYTGRLHQAANIPERERKGLASARVALNHRHMIGHQHAIVAHFFVNIDCFQHVDVAGIGECLLELQE